MLTGVREIIKIIRDQNKLLGVHMVAIVLFTVIYYYAAKYYGNHKDQENFKDFENSFYYTVITHFTIGFGDITPKSRIMRYTTILHVIIAFSLMNI